MDCLYCRIDFCIMIYVYLLFTCFTLEMSLVFMIILGLYLPKYVLLIEYKIFIWTFSSIRPKNSISHWPELSIITPVRYTRLTSSSFCSVYLSNKLISKHFISYCLKFPFCDSTSVNGVTYNYLTSILSTSIFVVLL